MVQVIKKGLETSVQDYPGRIGTLNQGFPASGPMDSWSFRLANILVGNKTGDAALECQFYCMPSADSPTRQRCPSLLSDDAERTPSGHKAACRNVAR